jgi:site-specific recombinase XerD
LIISRTFPDKDAHKEIIKNYILELKITKSNSMGSYQRDLLKHLKAYENIKGTECKKIITNIITEYLKTNKAVLQTGLNTRILVGPTGHHYHKWLLEMIRWTLETRQDLVSRNLWPKIEVIEDVEMTTMPIHQTLGNMQRMEPEQELRNEMGKY